MVLHGNRLEDLRELLTQFLKSQPLPPLVPEVILVQSNGMKSWLEMALADDGAMGVCAATSLELPSSYLWQVYRQVLGANAVPLHMPFDKSSLVWRLVRLLPILAASHAVYAPLKLYLGDAKGRKLYQLAMQVADVFDGYQSYRADWLGDWATDQNVLRNHHGQASELEAAHAWQAQLWRDIRSDVGEDLAEASRASVHRRFMVALKQLVEASQTTGLRPNGLPPRIVVFGISSLPLQTIEALAELGQVCQVLMLVQNPCKHYWGDIVEGHDRLRQQVRRRQQAKPIAKEWTQAPANASLHLSTHPLLASWGKQGRDYLHLLDDFDRIDSYQQRLTRVDAFFDPIAGQTHPSQLARLQSSILNLESQTEEALVLPDNDDTITFVTSHSVQREVEVLHDRLLTWFENDGQLLPRDVMVMVPDMQAFAPHIQAVFGRFAIGQARYIPFSVADTTARQSPLVQALSQLLSLPASRVTLADWLSLFEVDAVRQRFGLLPGDIEQAHIWLNLAGVRWGLNAPHRQAWGLPDRVPGLDQNTWAFGLRRLLLGYAVGGEGVWGGTLPQAGIQGLDAGLTSKLLDWIEAVNLTLKELSAEHTPSRWGDILSNMVERFFLACDDAQERAIQRLLEPLQQWQKDCSDAALDTPLALEVISDHWLSQIQETGLHQRFFGGGVQFATLMPMRSIPFKLVCLLGMNDGDYPRQTMPRDFDLMALSWRAGDRSRREDDRYLFLEALLSARQKLYISWQGHRSSDNSVRPPSVLVAQLIDFLNAGWTPPRTAQAQPLQPFSEAYFLQGSGFSTYDKDWFRVHQSGELPRPLNLTGQPTPSDLEAAVPPTQITLEELRKLLRQPVEVFFRSRMGIRLDGVEEAASEEEPFSLNGLEKYQVGQELLKAVDTDQALNHLQMSGRLPMASFGAREAVEFQEKLSVVLERRKLWLQQYLHAIPAQSVALTVDGVSVTGTLTGLMSRLPHDSPEGNAQGDLEAASHPAAWLQIQQRLGAVTEGKGKAQDQTIRLHIAVGLWVNHLAACASGLPLTSVQLGLDEQVVFKRLAQTEALEILQRIVRAYQAAWLRPLPVACKTAWVYLQAQIKADRLAADQPEKEAKSPLDAAQQAFEGEYYAGELSESAYLARAFQSYTDIENELPRWAQQLYGDMNRHVQLGQEEVREEGNKGRMNE